MDALALVAVRESGTRQAAAARANRRMRRRARGTYGNIHYRPTTRRLGCTFRCWSDEDFEMAKRQPRPKQTELL